ncbi:MAG TPA: hypothetical protein VMX16_05665 [Terriglobia bacterium]|nr:hypothetical protein [Terriglobia bacterium]
MKGSILPTVKASGERIITTLNEILDWCRAKARMQVPGEGGERPLRARLCEAFLEKLFGWPPDFILSGERYDISLLNPEDQPVITIETKEPGHLTARAEYQAFFSRLRHYTSIRHAYITNGAYWERYDIHAMPQDIEELTEAHFEDAKSATAPVLFEDLRETPQKAGRRSELRLNNAEAAQTEEFFAPLEPAIYLDLSKPLPPGTHRHKLTRENTDFIEAFSGALRDHMADFHGLFLNMFNRFRAGEVSAEVARVARDCFQLWCERSYVVPLDSLHRRAEKALISEDVSADSLARIFAGDYGFPAETAGSVGESLYAERKKKKSTGEKRQDLLWPLYSPAIRNYATQTAHVYVARLLLYRTGEDQTIFPERISGAALQPILNPSGDSSGIVSRNEPLSVSAIETLRAEMAGFAPSVYESGEFDWWRVVHREGLTESELGRAQTFEGQLDAANKSLLRLLSVYDLSGVDLDIWRDIYQHYLPEDERQQLGGFYTPQGLVDLTLDYAGYKPSLEKLCEKSLIDLASGSGAFIVSALQRLLGHLTDKSLPCHSRLHARGVPDWEQADAMLQIIAKKIHAIDIHPFAAFLTYINFLFAVLPLYARVRRQRKNFRLEAAIFPGNSLLTPGENAGQHELDLRVNSRIQSGRHARERYRAMAGERFDFAVGNPPWGGILKGRLAPIFDEHYKEQLAGEYRDTYTGKLDIYALFYDRALKLLRSGGTVALVTQGSFIDKEWAGPHTEYERGQPIQIIGLRRKLAEQASLRYLIDLNPFGQLFFGAMNIPCIAVFEKRPAYEGEEAVVLLSSKKSWPKSKSVPERRTEAVSIVRHCLELVEKSGEPLKQDFVAAFRFPLARLREFGGARWLLAPKEFRILARPDWPRAAQLLEPSQGVTVGGEGCLSIFLMTEARAEELGLEKALLYRIIKGHETKPWRPEWGGNVILYPYAKDKEGRWRPAFVCKKPPVLDALDFEHHADKFEHDLIRTYRLNSITIKRLFEHRRDALEIVKYPKAAEYLLKFYNQLSERTFKKRNVRDFSREWYEFIWPRDAEIIFGQPKIISPRLTPRVRFALDQEEIGIQDSCVSLAVSDNTRPAYDEFRKQLAKVLGHEVKAVTVFRYLLAFMNSSYSQELLTTGRRPTPKGHYQIDELFLGELSIPLCRTRRELQGLLDAVEACIIARTEKALVEAESRLDAAVTQIYAAR